MSDLDFDEIDRAVNSVISSGPASDSDNSQTVDSANVSPTETPATVPVGVPRPPVARRSSGQFMDVVHPSSNMRRTIDIPERPVSAPLAAMTTSEQPKIQTLETQPEAEPESTPEPQSTQNAQPEFNRPTADSYEDADIDKISDDINKAMSKTTDTSLEFPFISGTKVEKRPLGAFSADSPASPADKTDSDTQTDFAPQPSEGENSMITPGQAPLPAELQNDLLKIEADSTTMPENVVLPDEPAEEVTPPVEPSKSAEANETTKPEIAEESPRDVAEKAEPIGPTSIVQQYEEKPKTDNQKSGAIYDTESYHKTLVHPAKKKTGWLWVLYIAIFLVVGAGVGVAVYLFVIPALSSL